MKHLLILICILLVPAYFTKANETDNQRLLLAASDGVITEVNTALNDGADVNAKSNEDISALTLATLNDHTDIVKLLLDKGADVNGKYTENGVTALIVASDFGFFDIVKVLIDKNERFSW
jgi:ankyrin repeat protein